MDNSFLFLVSILSAAWLLIFIFAIKNMNNTPTVNALLGDFRRKVDHAHQLTKTGAKIDDQIVLRAFDELNADINRLLEKKKVELAPLKREVMTFLFPANPQSFEWRPPSLIDLGYLLYICKRYSKNAPVLAIYQLTREDPDGSGAVIGTFQIMRVDPSLAFPPAIRIRVDAPRQRIGAEPKTA
jgi:hypothetical protein